MSKHISHPSSVPADHLDREKAYIRESEVNEVKAAKQFRERKTNQRSSAYAAQVDADSALAHFDPVRFADPTDFDYRYRHRSRVRIWLRQRYDWIAAKLMYQKSDDKWGYFRTLVENGIDWKSEIALIATIPQPWAEAVCKCGIWTKGYGHPKNSGRCHDPLCRLCSWMDYGKLLRDSLGVNSGALDNAARKGQRFFAVHLSIRDHPANARALGRDLSQADLRLLEAEDGLYSEVYQARPVSLDATNLHDDTFGLTTCRMVFLACQQALKDAYKRRLVSGVKSKIETALLLMPTDALPHAHAIVTADLAVDPQHLADELKAEMDRVLHEKSTEMQLPLYASVRVFAITSATHLEKVVLYTEKVVPLGLLTKEVLQRKEATNPDRTYNAKFLDDLDHSLLNLHEQMEHLTTGFQIFGDDFHSFRQRLTLGNLRFGKHFIGFESLWHREYREKKKKEAAKKRKEQRDRKQKRPN